MIMSSRNLQIITNKYKQVMMIIVIFGLLLHVSLMIMRQFVAF